MNWFNVFSICIIGLVFGSFLNVCIYRIPRGNFWAKNKSYCPHCKSQLKWYDLIPVLSYLMLKGRCRVCREKISPIYPAVEALNGILWSLVFVVYGFNHMTIILMAFVSLLIVIAFIDLSIMEIPNRLVISVLFLAIIVFVLSFFELGFEVWWEHLIGMIAVSGLFFVISILSRGGIGAGDIKLMFAAGLLLGIRRSLITFFVGIIIAAIIGVALMLIYGKSRKSQMPLAPSLAIGMIVSILLGEKIILLFGNII